MINQKNVEKLYQLIIKDDECLCGSQWENFNTHWERNPLSSIGGGMNFDTQCVTIDFMTILQHKQGEKDEKEKKA